MSARAVGMDFEFTPKQRELYELVGELGKTEVCAPRGAMG